MRQSVLWRKEANIVMLLAQNLNISPEKALSIYYGSDVNLYMSSPDYGLQCMSDQYIVDEIINEMRFGG